MEPLRLWKTSKVYCHYHSHSSLILYPLVWGLTKDFFTSSTLLFLSLVQSYDENRQLSVVGQVRSMLEDYFFSECVQQVIIYDVRNFDGEIFFDCTIGSAVQKLEVCLCVVCYSWTLVRTFYKRSIRWNTIIHTEHWFGWFIETFEPNICRLQRFTYSGMIMLWKILPVLAVDYSNFLLSSF